MADDTNQIDNAQVDDMLIEMITPKVKEIEEKFGQGKGLTQDDINTLLLKSQYNHINHLDLKLDEVTADVASLKGDFAGLKGEFELLKLEINHKLDLLEEKFNLLEEKVSHTIQKAVNKNMMILVVVLSVFLTLPNIIDAL